MKDQFALTEEVTHFQFNPTERSLDNRKKEHSL